MRANTKFTALMDFGQHRDYVFEPVNKIQDHEYLGKLETESEKMRKKQAAEAAAK